MRAISFFSFFLHADFVFVYICPPRLTDKAVKEYAVYRSPLLFWGLVDLIYDMFRVRVNFYLQ